MSADRDDEINRRAYAIWEAEGRPSGRDFEHWERARQMLDAERAAAGSPGAEKAAVKRPRSRKPAAAKPAPAKPAGRKNGEARPV